MAEIIDDEPRPTIKDRLKSTVDAARGSQAWSSVFRPGSIFRKGYTGRGVPVGERTASRRQASPSTPKVSMSPDYRLQYVRSSRVGMMKSRPFATTGSDTRRPSFVGLTPVVLAGALVLAACNNSRADANESTISEIRQELLTAVIDVPGSDGYRYRATDDVGHEMDAAKIIEASETGGFAAVYHWWSDTTQQFTPSLATSENLLDWVWQVDLTDNASMPTIAPASDGGYVLAWEDDSVPRVGLSYYPTWEALLAGQSGKRFTAERLLSDCAEGTPNIYSASSEEVVFGFHFGCETARQARGVTDWLTWTAETEPLLDRAALFQGYRGLVGDRDVIEFRGHPFTFLESQFVQDDWRTFRTLLYDEELGAADRAGFPDAPAVPPSIHVFLFTHLGSSAFTNFTISEVTLDGHRALVMGVFIPQEGAHGDETGQLIYYRLLDNL